MAQAGDVRGWEIVLGSAEWTWRILPSNDRHAQAWRRQPGGSRGGALARPAAKRRARLGKTAAQVARLVALIACSLFATAQTNFRLATPAAVEFRLKSFSTSNSEREAIIRKWMIESGCKTANLAEQPLDPRLPPNVICVLPGRSKDVIMVGAHTDHVDEAGDGVIDNWSGAALLPSLLYSIASRPRHHTFVFVGFSAEEKGLVGSAYYAEHLTAEQRAHVAAMINMDSLGLGTTEVWATHADKILLDSLSAVAASTKLPVGTMNVDNLGSADSESFAPYHIARITLHSVTRETWSILHSPNDKLDVVKMKDYYDSYRLIAAYLAYLDDSLGKPTK